MSQRLTTMNVPGSTMVCPGVSPKKESLPLSMIARDLEEVERVFAETMEPFRRQFGPIIQHLDHYRGKRLRPMLLLLAAQATRGINRHHHILGAVVEMIHTATLVHDDVLDGANTRRHVATINANWGNQASILLGDMLFSAAFRLCASVDAQACDIIGKTTNRVCAGELLQLTTAGRLDLTEAEYMEIIAGKTGVLTECATRLGAIYAGTSTRVIDRLGCYGRNLGMAFQVADDVLDLRGDEQTAGKTLGTDLAQRKMTLPVIRYLQSLPEAENAKVFAQLATHDHDHEIVNAIIASGHVESAQRTAEGMISEATQMLTDLPHSSARIALEQLAHWSINRQA